MNKKFITLVIIGVILAAVGIIAATCVGAKTISLETIYHSIFHYEEQLDMQLVRDSRLPRAICSALVGGMLAMAGAMMQGITRNPVAEPSMIGMTQGAVLAVAAITVYGTIGGEIGNVLAALLGALFSGILILFLGIKSHANMNLSRLLLAGTALSTFFLSLASIIALLGNRSQELAFWVAGGFGNKTWDDVKLLLVLGGSCSVFCFFLRGKINILSLGEEVSIGLGLNPAKLRFQVIALLIPICASCVGVSGNIAFVGLIVPHIVRRLIGTDYRQVVPLSFIYGSVLLVWADITAKMINIPYETPIGLFTAMLGVPVFLFLVRKEKG